MNKLFPDFEYLSVLRGNGTAIEGPQKGRSWAISIDRHRSWEEGNTVDDATLLNFWKTVISRGKEKENTVLLLL